MKIDLILQLRELSDLTSDTKDGKKVNKILQCLDAPEAKTALVALILNEIRIFKAAQIKKIVDGRIVNMEYDCQNGFSKLAAWVDLIDITALISEEMQPEEEDDTLPM